MIDFGSNNYFRFYVNAFIFSCILCMKYLHINVSYRLLFLMSQVAFLQETVGRECEERLELTEALSKAREQLLVHQRGTSIANSSSTGRSSHSQLSLGGSSSPHQPTSPKGNPPSGLRRGSGGGGQSGGSKGARNSGSGGGGSLNDSRNRIATVLGKKELKIQINAGQ